MKALFFIGLVLPDPPAGAIERLKHSISDRYHNRHGLLTPPHITLAPPFRMEAVESSALKKAMAAAAAPFHPFRLVVEDSGTFGTRVLYLGVQQDAVLTKLHEIFSALVGGNQDKERLFVPHVTLAHKDIRPDDLQRAREEIRLQPFRAEVMIDAVSLLEHSGGRWNIVAAFPFLGS